MIREDIVAVIPAFECEATIGEVVAGARRFLADVVVVSDGSRDDTAGRAAAAGAHVDVLPENRGKGYALRRGIDLALERGPAALLLLDGDGQHDPGDIPALLSVWDAGGADLVVGSRLQDSRRIPPARYWTNYIGTRILTWMSELQLEDSQSGYRLLSSALARRMRLRSDGYEIESEMLIKAGKAGAQLRHVAVRTIYNDEESHFRPLTDTLRIALAAIQFKVEDEPS
ncbi:MAG: glycosyltransferase family 2 protein [Thermoanaerobaculia bacterium]